MHSIKPRASTKVRYQRYSQQSIMKLNENMKKKSKNTKKARKRERNTKEKGRTENNNMIELNVIVSINTYK